MAKLFLIIKRIVEDTNLFRAFMVFLALFTVVELVTLWMLNAEGPLFK